MINIGKLVSGKLAPLHTFPDSVHIATSPCPRPFRLVVSDAVLGGEHIWKQFQNCVMSFCFPEMTVTIITDGANHVLVHSANVFQELPCDSTVQRAGDERSAMTRGRIYKCNCSRSCGGKLQRPRPKPALANGALARALRSGCFPAHPHRPGGFLWPRSLLYHPGSNPEVPRNECSLGSIAQPINDRNWCLNTVAPGLWGRITRKCVCSIGSQQT